jgi:cytochrome c556
MARTRDFSLWSCMLRTAGRLVLIGAVLAVAEGVARSQDQGAAPPADEIIARKALMDSIDEHMNTLEDMVGSGQAVALDRGREHADTVSTMLGVFPFLFPASTNQWKPDDANRDPARDTYASPDVWKNFADFYKQAVAASKAAESASRAKQDDDFKKAIASLRTACNTCHAAYLKTDQ